MLLRQKRDEVPEGTLSCPDRNLAVFHHYRHYEGLRLLPSVCDSKLIQQTLTKYSGDIISSIFDLRQRYDARYAKLVGRLAKSYSSCILFRDFLFATHSNKAIKRWLLAFYHLLHECFSYNVVNLSTAKFIT